MHRKRSNWHEAKYPQRKKGSMSSVKGVSHLSRRAKRRLYCKLQLWMWRKWREKCRFAIFRAKKQTCRISPRCCLSAKTRPQKSKSTAVSCLGCGVGGFEGALRRQNRLRKLCQSGMLSDTFLASSFSQNVATDTSVPAGSITTCSPKTCTHPVRNSAVKPLLQTDRDVCGMTTHVIERRTRNLSPSLEADRPSGPGRDQAANMDTDVRTASKNTPACRSDTSLKALEKDIHEFLDNFYRTYGSFIPLQKSDVLTHLKRRFNTDVTHRKTAIFLEVDRYRSTMIQKPVPSFRVVYRKHTLTLDDLSTLADQNWLNDQVMNMYGELIMESADHKVHFLNSFFHRQLMTKGYEGVKRWTKQVDLFSKDLLLVPIHLEVHWCLVTADNVQKSICLYDSQGNALQKVARNILKYLMTEAKERKQTAFESGWSVSFDEEIPQQTNENDCGVFVLEYSRCLALGKPLQFSQKDIPKIRKRIYKELCDCRLHEQG